jgi:hypothetical protein
MPLYSNGAREVEQLALWSVYTFAFGCYWLSLKKRMWELQEVEHFECLLQYVKLVVVVYLGQLQDRFHESLRQIAGYSVGWMQGGKDSGRLFVSKVHVFPRSRESFGLWRSSSVFACAHPSFFPCSHSSLPPSPYSSLPPCVQSQPALLC